MRARFTRRGRSQLETDLVNARPQAPERLVADIVSLMRAPRGTKQRSRLRLAYAGVFTAVVIAGLAATGGLSYAASAISTAVHAVTPNRATTPHAVPTMASACSQYAVAPTVSAVHPFVGHVGTPVTIRGAHFSGVSKIRRVVFTRGVAAGFTVLSDSRLKTAVPKGAKTGVIKVFNCAGRATTRKFIVARCIVPKIVGRSLPVAKALVKASGCWFRYDWKYSSTVRAGHVISQSKPAGYYTKDAFTLRALISRGKK